MRLAVQTHVGLYRMSRGSFANTIANMPLLLLTTFGRRSGTPFTVPLVYLEDDQGYLVAATAAGMSWEPGWSRNLRARPVAHVEIGKSGFDVRAVFAEGEERTRLYATFKAASDNFAKYEQKTRRVFPVIRLIVGAS